MTASNTTTSTIQKFMIGLILAFLSSGSLMSLCTITTSVREVGAFLGDGTITADNSAMVAGPTTPLRLLEIEMSADGHIMVDRTVPATSTLSSSESSSASSTSSSRQPTNNCHVLRLLAFNEEIEAGETRSLTPGVHSFQYPIYEYTTGDSTSSTSSSTPPQQVGKYIGASMTIQDKDGNEDCIGTGAFNLDYNRETDSYDSQIYISVSCSGTSNAIIGGTGRYAYLQKGGWEDILDLDDDDDVRLANVRGGASLSELTYCYDSSSMP